MSWFIEMGSTLKGINLVSKSSYVFPLRVDSCEKKINEFFPILSTCIPIFLTLFFSGSLALADLLHFRLLILMI